EGAAPPGTAGGARQARRRGSRPERSFSSRPPRRRGARPFGPPRRLGALPFRLAPLRLAQRLGALALPRGVILGIRSDVGRALPVGLAELPEDRHVVPRLREPGVARDVGAYLVAGGQAGRERDAPLPCPRVVDREEDALPRAPPRAGVLGGARPPFGPNLV